jgi:hypothetical protein
VNLAINLAPQAISVVTPPPQTTKSGPLTLQATTTAGLPLTYTLVSGPATLSGTTLTFNGTPGVVIIQVSQPGNANNAAATSATITFTILAPNALINAAARGMVAPNQPLIVGFVVGGAGSEPALLRGIGPTLGSFGVTGALGTPVLQLFGGNGNLLLTNSGWAGSASLAATFVQVGAFPLAANSADAAAVATLSPGNYTAVVSGSGTASGVALAEIYDASVSPLLASINLINVSARGIVSAGQPLIAGFVVTGSAPMQVLVRGVGPTLTTYGVTGALTAPFLSLYNGAGTLIAQNQSWGTPVSVSGGLPAASAAAIAAEAGVAGAFALPTGSADSAVLVTLVPGAYTVVVSGVGTAAGVVLAEVYQTP